MTSIYVENYPPNSDAKSLWYTFSRFRTVMEIFIPGRLNRRGRSFSFIKTLNGLLAQYLLRDINGNNHVKYSIRASEEPFLVSMISLLNHNSLLVHGLMILTKILLRKELVLYL